MKISIRMNEIHLWLGLDKLTPSFEPADLRKDIVKMCKVNNHLFALTRRNTVYHSLVEQNKDFTIVFTNTGISATDIACDANSLLFINDCGQVYRANPEDLNESKEIVLQEDAKCCSHGYKTSGHKHRVKAISAEEHSCLYVTDNGQLWASGDQHKLGCQSEEPRKVEFFEKRCIISVASGLNFSLALAFKPGQCIPEKCDSDTDDENECDVFVSHCPLCISECVSSSMSQQSVSDMCPLGLQIQHGNSDHYSSSTTSKENTAEDKKSTDESTSVSVEEKADKKGIQCENGDTSVSKNGVLKNDEHEDSKQPESNDEIIIPNVLKENQPEGDESESESLKEEKKNEFFINTEAARQFLTRQLSWVSSYGGEELAEASLVRPTRIIKQNVSNMASLVYEGVKTVGDRGATLFRHMSGGSEEASDSGVQGVIAEYESFEELSPEELKIVAPSLTPSLSGGTSERESDGGLSERVSNITRIGSRMLATELWSWGSVTHGQLGVGDTVKRDHPTIVSRLTGIGTQRVACGRTHALAVTLDGRVFAWGSNHHQQVLPGVQNDQSSPQHLASLPERAKKIAAGDNHSLILSHDENVYYLGKHSNGSITTLDVPSLLENHKSKKRIFASGNVSGCFTENLPISSAAKDLMTEQAFLEELLMVQSAIVKPLQKKGAPVQENNVYEVLCCCHNDILSLTCVNIQSFWEYTEQKINESGIAMVQHIDEFVHVYRAYLRAACDVTALGGFAHIARLVDVPQRVHTAFSDRVHQKKGKKSTEAVVTCAFLHPLKRMKLYKCMIQSLMLQCNDAMEVAKKLQDAFAKWEQLTEEQEVRRNEANSTRQFWEGTGKVLELLRSPERRLIRESRSHTLLVLNSGRFSSHWFILLTDILVHVTGSTQNIHPLPTLWVESLQDTDSVQNAMVLTMPEETITVYTPNTLSPHEKTEWLQALQNAIKKSLQKQQSIAPPNVRTAKYVFTKHPLYKDAKYTGRWCNGKLQGHGKLEWPDGRVYIGQFQNSQMHGFGRMEIPGVSIYEGQWKEGQQDGYGTIKYTNGDVYEGHFKDGVAHGHGVRKEGHFMASVASVYIGEWVNGVKQGYGVMDDIVTGEKYLGCWSNNMKHGCGLIVTPDGIYYEGVFMQDVLTGHGVMVFEDGTHYEGEFRAAGVFSGKGTLMFNSGDRLEGNLYGAWNEGIKVTGTLYKNITIPPSQLNSKPSSFGKICVAANQKWKAIFRQCYQQLEPRNKAWENVAVLINSSRVASHSRDPLPDSLDKIPKFGQDKLDNETYQELRNYLVKAFECQHHPLGRLLSEVTAAYTTTYGGVRVHPLLLSHAVAELHSITSRVYEVVRVLFPALPPLGQELHLGEGTENEGEVVSAAGLLHPVLLPRVHSALFVLYALHNKQEDDAYWKRLLKWNKQPDLTLMAFLGIDQKFWVGYSPPVQQNHTDLQFASLQEQLFKDAVETLQQLKTTFSPYEKLLVIRSTFEQMTRAVQQELGTTYLWTMDDLFPVFHFVVVRSRILQLGSEIHFIEDFMEPYLQNGELGIMFTTLKACYYQILQEKSSMSI